MSESFADTIKPKSDQLNADDMLTGPITVTVKAVKRGNAEQPVHILIDGHQPFKPCKSMRRVLIAAWGDKGADWVGKSMTLYCDPNVKFGGVAVGGIRISHLSDIDTTMSIMLTASRGKKSQYTVKALKVTTCIDFQAPNREITDVDRQWMDAARKDPRVLDRPEVDQEYKKFILESISK